MELGWLGLLGGLLLLAGLATLAYDGSRKRRDNNPYSFPDNATNALDDTALQNLVRPQPQLQHRPMQPPPGHPSAALSQLPGRTPGAFPQRLRQIAPATARRGGGIFNRLAAAPRRLLVVLAAASIALLALSVGILWAGPAPVAYPPGTIAVGVAQFGGAAGHDIGAGLAEYIAKSTGAAGLTNVAVRRAAAAPVSAESAAWARERLGLSVLVWGEQGAAGAITVGLALDPAFGPGARPWERYADPDPGLVVLPEHAVLYFPEGRALDPVVPLVASLAYLGAGRFEEAGEAAWGAQATMEQNGVSSELGRLVEAAARYAREDYAGAIASVDVLGASPSAEARTIRAAAHLYAGGLGGAQSDAEAVLASREASDRVLARAQVVRARAWYRSGAFSRALAALDEAERLDPSYDRVRLDRAEVYYRQAQPAAAAEQASALPPSAQSYRLLGLVRLMLGQPDEALRVFQLAAQATDEWTAALRTEEARAQSAGETRRAHAATDGIVKLNRQRAELSLYQGMALADVARSEPPETFLGGVWRNLRGEKTTAERAIAQMQEAARLDPRRPDIPLQMASVYAQAGDFDGATEALGQAKALDPSAPEPYAALSRLYESNGMMREAAAALEELIGVAPWHYPAYADLSRLYRALGDEASARGALERAAAIEPQSPGDHLWRGKYLRALDRREEAERELRLAAEDPEKWEAHLELGQLLLEEGRGPSALAEFEAVLEVRPNSERALLGAGRLMVLAGRHDEAQTLFERLVAIAPRNVEGRIALLELLISKHQFDRAVEQGQRAVEADGGRADTHFFLGLAYEARGDWHLAAPEYRAAAERDPSHFQAFLNLAKALLKQDLYLQAIEVCDKAINMRPDDPQSYTIKAEAQIALGNPGEAIATLERALAAAPNDSRVLSVLSRAYLAAGDIAAAAAYGTQASSHGHRGALALGEAHLSGGRPREALDAFGRAAELSTGNDQAVALTGRGRAFAALNDIERAQAAFADAMRADPRAAEPHLYAGALAEQMGDSGSAFDEYRAAVAARPNWPVALYSLGRAYLQRGDHRNAEAALAKAVENGPNMMDAWFALGIARRTQGSTGPAVDALSRAVQLQPGHAEAWLYLGLSYEEAGARPEAIAAFERAYDTAASVDVRTQAEEGLARVR
ncbi:MAG TPA: tetratricopeptide repeat protein [Chloroflexia bacterium]|nr:tetratricopeptide repeat protein [Chloroflexia bacterium]